MPGKMRSSTIGAIEEMNNVRVHVAQPQPAGQISVAKTGEVAQARSMRRAGIGGVTAIAVGVACFVAPPVAAVAVAHGVVHAVAADTIGGEVLAVGSAAITWGVRKLRKGSGDE
jgi:hypothetical protein